MSIIADLIRAGVDPELIERVHQEIVDAAKSSAPQSTARQARNARYYAKRKASEPVLSKTIETSKTDSDAPPVLIKTVKTVSDDPPSPKESSPTPPKEITPTPHSSSLRSDETHARDLRFEFEQEFWPKYPHKVGKPAALRAFGAARKRAQLHEIIIGLGRYIRDKAADRSWLNPATFLNQDRFADEPAKGPPARASPHRETTGEALLEIINGGFSEGLARNGIGDHREGDTVISRAR